MKCHQRKIRDEIMKQEPRPVMTSLDGCFVKEITTADAKPIIMTYEWLGSIPKIPAFQYGLFDSHGELIGVAMFGQGNGIRSKWVCGEENANITIPLERGACVHWAHPHAASFLISKACQQAYTDHGYQIFYAYSDVEAGEIGTVYQACNWLYIGQAAGRNSKWRYVYIPPTSNPCSPHKKEITSRVERAVRKKCGHTLDEHMALGWTRRQHYEKHKYVWIQGSKSAKRVLGKALQYPALPYPKRN